MSVIAPDYRLAPEHPYPAGLKDIIACLRGAIQAAEGLGPGPLIVSGDSAGANLALAAIVDEFQSAQPLAAGAVLFCGNFGLDIDTASYRQFADGPGLTRERMRRYVHWYVGDSDLRADPLAGSDEILSTLSPIFLVAAGIDPLLSAAYSVCQIFGAAFHGVLP